MYENVLSNAQEFHEQYKKRASNKYHYWEIGGENSIGIGPMQNQSQAKIKIKATINHKLKAHNAVEEVIQWRKFEQIKWMILKAIESLSPEMALVLLSVMWDKS